MLVWKVIETPEFGEWYGSLDDDAKEDILAKVEVLKAIGPGLGRPQVDTVKGSRHPNLKELRVQSNGRPFRILFAFDPKRQAVLLVGGNKEGDKRFYDRLIPQADDLFDEYLASLKKEKPSEKRKK
jgi:hypothetical protein